MGLTIEEAFGQAEHASPLMDAQAAAKYLDCSVRLVKDLWNRREIPAIKVGRLVRFHKADLDRYIESQRQGRPSA